MIATVVLWSNGTVMVFSDNDEQLPEYQGRIHKARAALRDADTSHAKFYIGVYEVGITEMPRTHFFSECWECDER